MFRPQVNRSSPQFASHMIDAGAVITLLYAGRRVLVPIAMAIMLSFLIAPLVRALRRLGIGQGISVCLAVLAFSLSLLILGAQLGEQLVHLGSEIPQYQATIHDKISQLNQLTLGQLNDLTKRTDQLFGDINRAQASVNPPSTAVQGARNVVAPMTVELQTPKPGPIQLLLNIAGQLSSMLETVSVVMIVLIFVLLEQDTLGDRFIRLTGPGSLRVTTAAVSDAAQRLSHYFVSQFAVNLAVGIIIGLGLKWIGVPQAFLWGAMSALLRFVPYIGMWIACLCASLLAAAISPGWLLAVQCIAVFLVTELIVSQFLEPHLYGHSTGLSALSVVLSAIFWSALWGPAGLVLSTPLTLCMVVAGRYLPALRFLDILFGDAPSLDLPERFYQRVLRGDTHGLIFQARQFLRKHTLGTYCDKVLIPAMFLAKADFDQRDITADERRKVNRAIISLLGALEGRKLHWRGAAVLDGEPIARSWRRLSESGRGQRQGTKSVVAVIAADGEPDELAAEILLLALRAQHLDARRLSLRELSSASDIKEQGATIALVWLVRMGGNPGDSVLSSIRQQLPLEISAQRVRSLHLLSPYGMDDEHSLRDTSASEVFHQYQTAIKFSTAFVLDSESH
ncbi:AI-2E family transporter [Paludibacterium purpuratum]|uniref:Putative PurR-regulated permease PerM n=1 Tax=Paludibacterium purpuratum TaxID=1144873 RepID=A0A4R7AZC8_9NEIS|nr:AI-2E family transporter [Paludibacterium purpuratum]TDR72055.1 putative PurR-regulated permease PerM [Paludibacterium purpuratum]